MIRVLIVDDHKVVRQGLRFLLEQEDGIEVVGECADGASALQAVRSLAPTVVLLDLFMPGDNGLDVLTQIKAEHPAIEVLMLTSSNADEHLLAAVRAGALAYLPKTAGVDQVVASVRAAARGESLLELARGRSNREIARALAISEETVKAHVSSILAKLQLADRTQAAIFGLQQRLVPLDDALNEEGAGPS